VTAIGEALSESGEDSRRHVPDHLGDGGRLAAVVKQEGAEFGYASLALARRHEDDRFGAAIHVEERGWRIYDRAWLRFRRGRPRVPP
jgi:hypothetical protein